MRNRNGTYERSLEVAIPHKQQIAERTEKSKTFIGPIREGRTQSQQMPPKSDRQAGESWLARAEVHDSATATRSKAGIPAL